MRIRHFLHYMLREARGSLGRLGFFVACLAVGVAAVVAVAGLSEGLATGVGREARQLMAADLVIEGSRSLPPGIEAALASEIGGERATLKEMATIVVAVPRRAPEEGSERIGTSQLVELKSVDGDYPFYGDLALEPAGSLGSLLGDDRAVVAPDLLERLGLEVGDRLRIGQAEFEIAGVVLTEPDRIGMALTAGPRVFVSGAGLARADLERFGSRISYRTLVRLPGEVDRETLEAIAETIRAWPEIDNRYRVSTYTDAQPAVRNALRRVDRFLGLVALLALLLGGVGVAQTTRAWLEGRTDAMAILRSIGFRPNEVFLLYFGQALALGLAGSALGVAGGVGVLALAPTFVADLLPQGLDISPWQPAAVLRGLALGLGTALLFSFSPLLAVRRVSPLRVLRNEVEPIRSPSWARWLTAAVLLFGVGSAATLQASSIRYGFGFTAGVALAVAILGGVSVFAIGLLRASLLARATTTAPVWLRQGLGAVVRPGAGAAGAIVALGLGVLLIVGIHLVQSGLGRQLSTALPTGAPSAFLIDIQTPQWEGIKEILTGAGARSIHSAPVVTARIARLDGETAEELSDDAASRGQRWALSREQRVTYLEELAPDNEILDRDEAAPLWRDPALWELSVEESYARDLGLVVGSQVELDVQGVPIEFTVTSLRSVDWGTFDLNFYFVAEPAALLDAPQYRVATVGLPSGAEGALQDRLAAAYPNVTLIQIRDVIEKVRAVLDRLALGVQFLGAFTVLAGLVILAGAVSANSIRRGREIAILKTLGMERREIALMFTVEFAVLGLLAGSIGTAGGVLLARTVLTRGMEIAWTFQPLPVAVAVTATVVLAAAAAVLAGSRALSSRPLEALRGD